MTDFNPVTLPVNLALGLEYIAFTQSGAPFDYTNLNGNTETDYDNVVWNDERLKPEFATVVAQSQEGQGVLNLNSAVAYSIAMRAGLTTLLTQLDAAITAYGVNVAGVASVLEGATTVEDLKLIIGGAIADMGDQLGVIQTAIAPFIEE